MEHMKAIATASVPIGVPIKPSVIRKLSLRGSHLTSNVLFHLQLLRNLEELDVSECPNLCDHGMARIYKELNMLSKLNLNNSVAHVSEQVLVHLCHDLRRVRELELAGATHFTDDAFGALFSLHSRHQRLEQITVLNARHCPSLSAASMSVMPITVNVLNARHMQSPYR
jgi:hypothetical protein